MKRHGQSWQSDQEVAGRSAGADDSADERTENACSSTITVGTGAAGPAGGNSFPHQAVGPSVVVHIPSPEDAAEQYRTTIALLPSEFRAGEFVAWRAWRLHRHGDTITSCYMNDVWTHGSIISGRPVDAVESGVHAWKNRNDAIDYAKEILSFRSSTDEQVIVGQVKLWGNIIEHEHGYRAQHGQLAGITDHLTLPNHKGDPYGRYRPSFTERFNAIEIRTYHTAKLIPRFVEQPPVTIIQSSVGVIVEHKTAPSNKDLQDYQSGLRDDITLLVCTVGLFIMSLLLYANMPT